MLNESDAAFKTWLATMHVENGLCHWRAWSTGAYEPTNEVSVTTVTKSIAEVRVEWDIAYAAASAAIQSSLIGRIRPG